MLLVAAAARKARLGKHTTVTFRRAPQPHGAMVQEGTCKSLREAEEEEESLKEWPRTRTRRRNVVAKPEILSVYMKTRAHDALHPLLQPNGVASDDPARSLRLAQADFSLQPRCLIEFRKGKRRRVMDSKREATVCLTGCGKSLIAKVIANVDLQCRNIDLEVIFTRTMDWDAEYS